MQQVNLTNHFLIAMPSMVHPNFARTLTYVCEHNEQGALGVVVNRPLDMTLALLFDRINLTLETPGFGAMPVYFGGPVQTDRGFVLHRQPGQWQATLAVNGEVALTSSRDILESVGNSGEPSDILVTLGYAGWAAGQLEWELSQNASNGSWQPYWFHGSEPELDKMLDDMVAEIDPVAKKALVSEINKKLAEEAYVVADGSQNTQVLTTAKLQGFFARADDSNRAIILSDFAE